MMKERINIALMAGGDSSEREVSLGSAAQVYRALDRSKYDVFMVDVEGREWTCIADDGTRHPVDKNDFSTTVAGEKSVFDYALILIHGTPGEDGRLQGYLDMMGVGYSSCGVASSVVTFDKQLCKRVVAAAGLNVAREVFVRRGERVDADAMAGELGLPMFVKPNASGSSCGVTKVASKDGVLAAVEAAFAESDAVLAEELVTGREIACGVMVTEEREYVFPLTEIVSKRDFFDYQAKYTPGLSDEITPAEVDGQTAAEIRRMSLAAYRACRCRGVVRVDYIVRPDGTPVFIELNSVPGMSAGSIVPKQAASAGMSLGELFDIVIKATYDRDRR